MWKRKEHDAIGLTTCLYALFRTTNYTTSARLSQALPYGSPHQHTGDISLMYGARGPTVTLNMHTHPILDSQKTPKTKRGISEPIFPLTVNKGNVEL